MVWYIERMVKLDVTELNRVFRLDIVDVTELNRVFRLDIG